MTKTMNNIQHAMVDKVCEQMRLLDSSNQFVNDKIFYNQNNRMCELARISNYSLIYDFNYSRLIVAFLFTSEQDKLTGEVKGQWVQGYYFDSDRTGGAIDYRRDFKVDEVVNFFFEKALG